MNAVVRPAPRLRPMSRNDIDAVLEIERELYLFPWSYGIFDDCLKAGYSCWVYESEDGIIGYGVMSLAADECHILNLCIHDAYQRSGFGRRLLRALLDHAHGRSVETAFLEVRASNEAALALYRSEGFHQIGHRKAYYPHEDGREDALVMSKRIVGVP